MSVFRPMMSEIRPLFRGEAVLRVDKGDSPIEGWDRPQEPQHSPGSRGHPLPCQLHRPPRIRWRSVQECGPCCSLTIDGLEPVSGDPKAPRMLYAARPVSEKFFASQCVKVWASYGQVSPRLPRAFPYNFQELAHGASPCRLGGGRSTP
jgi:hypothetical protein